MATGGESLTAGWIWFCQTVTINSVLVVTKETGQAWESWIVIFGLEILQVISCEGSWDLTILSALQKAFWFNLMKPSFSFQDSLPTFWKPNWRSLYKVLKMKSSVIRRYDIKEETGEWQSDILDILLRTQGRMVLAPQHPSSGSGLWETEMIWTHGIMTWNGALGSRYFRKVACNNLWICSQCTVWTNWVCPAALLKAWGLASYILLQPTRSFRNVPVSLWSCLLQDAASHAGTFLFCSLFPSKPKQWCVSLIVIVWTLLFYLRSLW